ncbi:MAG: hypothetical protein NC388_08695 [Clostridium sp.]|nr:hypothetical protein [Clostridium sp.]
MKNYLLLTALAMTASVAATAQVKVLEKPANLDVALKGMKVERKTTMQRQMLQQSDAVAKTTVVKGANKLGTKSIQTVTLKDEETPKFLYYRNPSLTFYTAPCGGYIMPMMYQPAFADITWRNVSPGYSASDAFEWSYTDIEGDDATSSVVNLTSAHYASGKGVTPVLSCGEESYQFTHSDRPSTNGSVDYSIAYGVEPKFLLGPDEETGEEWYLQLYDVWENHCSSGLFYAYTATSDPDMAPMVSAEWKDIIDEDNADLGVETQSVKVTSLGNLLPDPVSPYILSKVTFPVCVVNEAGAEVTLNIYSLDENGKLHKLTSSTAVIEDAHAVTSEGYSIVDLAFDVKYTDELGMIQNYLTVSTPIFIELDNINDNEKITEFMGLGVKQDYYDKVLYQRAYFGVTGVNADVKIGDEIQNVDLYISMPEGPLYYGDATRTWLACVTSFDMTLDAYYPYMALYDTDNDFATVCDSEVTIELPTTDAGKSYQVTSYDLDTDAEATPEDWMITDEKGDELPEWLNVSFSTLEEDGYVYYFLDFTADDNDGASRKATVVIDAAGAVKTFQITQLGTDGAGNGISSVEAVAGEAGVAAVYTLEGKRVASTDDLAKGVYIVKKNDGSAVKVVKK